MKGGIKMTTAEERYQKRKLSRNLEKHRRLAHRKKLSDLVTNAVMVVVAVLAIVGFLTLVGYIEPPIQIVDNVVQP